VHRSFTSMAAACIGVILDSSITETKLEISLVRCDGVLGGLGHLWVEEWCGGGGGSRGEPR